MRKVLATSKGGRTLVAFGWVNVRICDGAGVKAATVCPLDLRNEICADPDLMDFVDLARVTSSSNQRGPPRNNLMSGAALTP